MHFYPGVSLSLLHCVYTQCIYNGLYTIILSQFLQSLSCFSEEQTKEDTPLLRNDIRKFIPLMQWIPVHLLGQFQSVIHDNIFNWTASPISFKSLTKTPWFQKNFVTIHLIKRLINTKQVLFNKHSTFLFVFFLYRSLFHPPLPLPATFYLNYQLIYHLRY